MLKRPDAQKRSGLFSILDLPRPTSYACAMGALFFTSDSEYPATPGGRRSSVPSILTRPVPPGWLAVFLIAWLGPDAAVALPRLRALMDLPARDRAMLGTLLALGSTLSPPRARWVTLAVMLTFSSLNALYWIDIQDSQMG